MNRRSLIFRGLCAFFGLTAARPQADSAVGGGPSRLQEVAPLLKWTVWMNNDTRFDCESLPPIHETRDFFDGDGLTYRETMLVFRDWEGNATGQVNLKCVKAYGCAYPPQKVGKDWLVKRVTVHAPPHQSLV